VTDCIRGCTRARRHATDCEDRDTCRGCLPVAAEYGWVCERCHLRLSATLSEVPGQYKHLLEFTQPSQELRVRPQSKHPMPDVLRYGGLRIESDGPFYQYVKQAHHGAPQEGEPVRIACLDVAQELADLIAEWVEWVCDAYGATGPKMAQSAAERAGHKRRKAVHPSMTVYKWVDPPVRFEVGTAVRWLRNNLERLENMQAIGDMIEDLNEVMSRAHALAPWREQAKRLPAIPCPECQRPTLQVFGGRDTVTCTTSWCRTEIPHERYLIWARMYEEEMAG